MLKNDPQNLATKKTTPTTLIYPLIGFGLGAMATAGVLFWQNQDKPKVETVTREGVLSKIQSLNRLQTVLYNVDTVITAEKQGTWQQLWQDEQKGLFVAHGRVQAGVDLNLLKPEDVLIEDLSASQATNQATIQTADSKSPNKKITITLPSAQVFDTYLDNVAVYDIKTGLFGAMPTDPQIFNQAQAVGKQQVLATACKSDILQLATDNAQKQIQSLFALAKVDVTVTTSSVKDCA